MRVWHTGVLGALAGVALKIGLNVATQCGIDWAPAAWNHVDPIGDEAADLLVSALQRTDLPFPLGPDDLFEVVADFFFAVECAALAVVTHVVIRWRVGRDAAPREDRLAGG